MAIPADFARCMAEVYGGEGVAWIERLPALLDDCARRWGLTVEPPFALSYNYVAPALRADGAEVVLKVGFPSRELQTELAALRLYDGHGMVQLLDACPDRGAMLLERLTPGTTLAPLARTDDEQATSIAASVMRELWRGPAGMPPPPGLFPSVADWARGMQRLRAEFDGGTGPFPRGLVEAAETLFAELIPSQAAPVLLHGDLHHENILAAARQPWLALDPKGLAGEPAYEVGALLRNQLPEPLAGGEARRITARRVDQLAAELGFDRARIRGWGLAQAVLSAWWTYEDHGHVGDWAIECAELLAEG